MKPFEKVAVDFASALVEKRFDDAHSLLNPDLQIEFPADKLAKRMQEMFEVYSAYDAPKKISFRQGGSMEDWPAKKPDDVGWAYVGILGDHSAEGVAVVVADLDDALRIRELEWGRP